MHSSVMLHVMSVSNEITELCRDACSAICKFSWSRICSGVNLGNFRVIRLRKADVKLSHNSPIIRAANVGM